MYENSCQFDDPIGQYRSAFKMILQYVVTIKLVHDNGFEYWIVRDFEKGAGVSKWYRGHACEPLAALRLAFMNLSGIKLPSIEKTNWGDNIYWLRFAERLANDQGNIFICFNETLHCYRHKKGSLLHVYTVI